MKNLNQKQTNETPAKHFVDFSKASPEAIDQILSALNREVDAALRGNRFPTLEGAFGHLNPSNRIMM